jgi:tetratricopeptide (TPR) repeat protein
VQLDEAIRRRPKDAVRYGQRAYVHQQRSELKEALDDYESAIRYDGGRALRAQHYTQRGRLLLMMEKYEEARRAALDALGCNPDHSPAHVVHIAALLELKEYGALLSACDGYLARDDTAASAEDRAALYRLRATARTQRQDYRGAQADYQRALDLLPDGPDTADLYTRRGYVYLLSDAPKPALAEFDEAIKRDANSAEAFNGRGLARVSLGQLGEGVKDSRHAVSLAKDDKRTLYNAARTFAHAAVAAKEARSTRDVVRSYQKEACDYLGRSMTQRGKETWASFWHDAVLTEPALRGLRGCREFDALEAEIAPR